MGFFGKLFGKKDDVEEVAVSTAAKSTEKTETQATFTIDMSKEHLNNVLIDMSKGSKIDMTKHTAIKIKKDYPILKHFKKVQESQIANLVTNLN